MGDVGAPQIYWFVPHLQDAKPVRFCQSDSSCGRCEQNLCVYAVAALAELHAQHTIEISANSSLI